jgi:hypothetical protein
MFGFTALQIFGTAPDGDIAVSATDQFVSLASSGTGALLSLVLIITGIGLFYAKRWSRSGAAFASWAKIVAAIVFAALALATAHYTPAESQTGAGGAQRMQDIAMSVGTVIAALVRLIFPGVLLAILSMPQVKATLRRR